MASGRARDEGAASRRVPRAALACGWLLAFSCLGASGGAAPAQPDILRYDLTIRPDIPGRRLSVDAIVRIDNAGMDSVFAFGLNDRYDRVAVSARAEGGSQTPCAATVERGPGWVGVHVTPPRRALSLTFDLSGVLGKSVDENVEVVSDSSLFLLWSDRWYPISYDDWATVRTTVVLPERFRVVAPGRRIAPAIFETTEPAVCFSAFADSRWVCEERNVRGIPMEVLLLPESRRHAEAIFRGSSEVLDFYHGILGSYPFDRFAFATIRGLYARRAFPGFVAYSPAYLDEELSTTGPDAHETALLWWDYTARGSGPGAWQWTEGFGDYLEILYDEAYGRPLPSVLESFRNEYRTQLADRDVPPDSLRGNSPQALVHGKYPWLLHLLRGAVGDAPFRASLRLLFQRYAHRTFTLDDFIATLAEGCGQRLDWWRQDWVERPGIPRLAVRIAPDGERVRVRITQGEPPRRFPLEIGGLEAGRSEGRMDRIRLWISSAETDTTIASASGPDSVRIDPSGWLPAKIVVSRP